MPAQIKIINMLTELVQVGTVGLLSPAVDIAANFAGGREIKSYLDGSALLNMTLSPQSLKTRSLLRTACARFATPLRERISARFQRRTSGKYAAFPWVLPPHRKAKARTAHGFTPACFP